VNAEIFHDTGLTEAGNSKSRLRRLRRLRGNKTKQERRKIRKTGRIFQ
jgi:hypothetical protein